MKGVYMNINNNCETEIKIYNLLRQIKKEKPDLIHIHELHGYFVNIIQLLKFFKS